MAKLQLYLAKSLHGYKSLINFNPSEDVARFINELRRPLELIDYNAKEKNLFYLLSYIEGGTVFTIIRTIPEGSLDHLAANIFIPHDIIITGDELYNIVKITGRKISNSRLTDEDIVELRSLFNSDYPIDRNAAAHVPSEGREYACCQYGSGDNLPGLRDFLGSKIFQPTFLPYAGVLLLDADLNITHRGKDLTMPELQETTVVNPPADSEEGFTPHVYHLRFNHPYRLPLNAPIQISWKRSGFETIEQTISATGEDFEIPMPDTTKSRKSISPSSFYITSQLNKTQLNDAVIKVNGKEISTQTLFPYAELVNAKVEITAPGYFPYSATIDLASTMQALVQLRELRKVYRFELPLIHAEQAAPMKFEVYTKKEIHSSPIEGYVISEASIQEGTARNNHLIYAGTGAQKSKLHLAIAAGIGLIIGFLIAMLIFMSPTTDNIETSDTTMTTDIVDPKPSQPTQPIAQPITNPEPAPAPSAEPNTQDAPTAAAVPTEPQSKVSKADAIKYLDSNAYWDSEDMAKYPDLAGLFDDMNNYRFDRITTHWADTLKGSKSFGKVVRAVKGSATKRNPSTGKHKPTFTTTTKIQWIAYTYWVDP